MFGSYFRTQAVSKIRDHFGFNLKQNEAQSPRAESAYKGVNWRSKYVTQVQLGPESPTITLTWVNLHECKYKVHKLHQRYILIFVVVLVLLISSAN